MQNLNLVGANDVIGKKVIDIQNRHLGKINELVIHKLTGKINYVTIKQGNMFGIGGDSFTLSWDNLYYEPRRQCYIANANKDNDDLNEADLDLDKAWQNALSHYFMGMAF